MRLAIVLEDIHLHETGSSLRRIVLFDADEDVIVAVGEDRLSLSDINYVSLWLLGRRVSRLYCDGLDRQAKALLERAGIEVFPLTRIRDNPILHALLLDSTPQNDKKS